MSNRRPRSGRSFCPRPVRATVGSRRKTAHLCADRGAICRYVILPRFSGDCLEKLLVRSKSFEESLTVVEPIDADYQFSAEQTVDHALHNRAAATRSRLQCVRRRGVHADREHVCDGRTRSPQRTRNSSATQPARSATVPDRGTERERGRSKSGTRGRHNWHRSRINSAHTRAAPATPRCGGRGCAGRSQSAHARRARAGAGRAGRDGNRAPR